MSDILTRAQYDEVHALNTRALSAIEGKNDAELGVLTQDTLDKIRSVLGASDPATRGEEKPDTSVMTNLGLAIALYNRNRDWVNQYRLGLSTLQMIAKGMPVPWGADPEYYRKIVDTLGVLRPALESLLRDLDA